MRSPRTVGTTGAPRHPAFSVCPPLPLSPDEVVTSHGAIEADKDHVRQEPYSLPQGFAWDTLDLGSAEVVSRAPRARAQRGTARRSARPSRARSPATPPFAPAAPRALHAAERELRGGRRQHVPLRLLARVPALVGPAGRGGRAGGREQVSACPRVPPPPGAHWRLFSLPAVDFRALRPPGWRLQWHCGVRVSSNRKLVGFISAIPANIRIYDRCVIITRRCPV